MGALNEESLKVGMTDGFGLDVPGWVKDEELTEFTATGDDKIQIEATSFNGYEMRILATGLKAGIAEVLFDYHTPTRHDTFKMSISIIEY